MTALQKVVISSYNLVEFGNIVMDLDHPLPLDKITLVLAIYPELPNPAKENKDNLREWAALDLRLKSHISRAEGLSKKKPLHFYVIGGDGRHNEEWLRNLLPKFTERPEVVVDQSLIFDVGDTGWGV